MAVLVYDNFFFLLTFSPSSPILKCHYSWSHSIADVIILYFWCQWKMIISSKWIRARISSNEFKCLSLFFFHMYVATDSRLALLNLWKSWKSWMVANMNAPWSPSRRRVHMNPNHKEICYRNDFLSQITGDVQPNILTDFCFIPFTL